MVSVRKIALIVSFFYLPAQSMAWGLLGHRIVGQVAETYLTARAKTEVLKILGAESIAMASNWADFIKSDSSFDYLYSWHYINFKAGTTKNEFQSILANDTAVNAYTKINFIVKELKNKKLKADLKLMYLRLLIHFVGDIHQPMHVGRPEDQGGNKVKVFWFNVAYNLHSVWDSHFINFQQLSYTEYANAVNHVTTKQKTAWQKQPLSEWLYDSYEIAEKIYADVKPEEKLGYDYNFKYLETLNTQLLKGGIHLAALLNDIFKN